MSQDKTIQVDITKFQHAMIVDLEATCCDQGTIGKEEMETIEIGAVMVNLKTLKVVDEFQIFIKPVRYPILTEFCKQLTSIKQSDVDQALPYPEAIQKFQNWMKQHKNFVFCSWGSYDRSQLEKDSTLHKLPYPIAGPHINIKMLFSETQKLKKRFGMKEALILTEIPLEGTHHRGIDDARNMVHLMPYVLGWKTVTKKK